VNEKAVEVVKILEGWSWWESRKGHIYGLNYPYAIVFGSSRRMMRVGFAKHPDISGELCHSNTKIVLPIDMSAKQMATEIKNRLIPKVLKITGALFMDETWELTHDIFKERMKKWKSS
jgi:hypothetical protein